MGNPIIDFIKFLYNDIKTDIQFVNDLLNGKRKIQFTKEQIAELKDWRGILKENWLFFIIVASAFCAGYFFATVHLNNACADVVREWVAANPNVFNGGYGKVNYILNYTLKID